MKYPTFRRRYKRGPIRRKTTPPIEPEPPPKPKEPPDKKKYRVKRPITTEPDKLSIAIKKRYKKLISARFVAGSRHRKILEQHMDAREHRRQTHYHRRGSKPSYRRRQHQQQPTTKIQPTEKPSKNPEVIHAPPPTYKKVSTQRHKFHNWEKFQPPPNNSPFCTFIDDESDNEYDSYNDTCYFSNNAINDKLLQDEDDQIGKTSPSTTSSAICGVY